MSSIRCLAAIAIIFFTSSYCDAATIKKIVLKCNNAQDLDGVDEVFIKVKCDDAEQAGFGKAHIYSVKKNGAHVIETHLEFKDKASITLYEKDIVGNFSLGEFRFKESPSTDISTAFINGIKYEYTISIE